MNNERKHRVTTGKRNTQSTRQKRRGRIRSMAPRRPRREQIMGFLFVGAGDLEVTEERGSGVGARMSDCRFCNRTLKEQHYTITYKGSVLWYFCTLNCIKSFLIYSGDDEAK